MAHLNDQPIRTRADLQRFEAEMPLAQRLPESSILDVFIGTAQRAPERTAITLLMTGAPDEQPRRVSYCELLGLVRRAANLFATLAGPRPGVAYMLPSLIETHATLWGAETAGYAVPINFLLQAEHIAALVEASGAKVLVALGPHPVLDIWQKALRVRERVPGLVLLRVEAPGMPQMPRMPRMPGVPGAPEPAEGLDFHAALMAQPDTHLVFGEPGQGDDVAAYFHTGGTTGTPKLVAHTHCGQLVAALGGAVLGHMQPDDVVTATLPLFHVGGTIHGGLSAFMAGMEVLIMSPSGLRNPAMVQGFWRLCAQYGATRLGAVPTSLGAVADVPLAGADLGAVRASFTGAASLAPALGDRWRRITGRPLHEVYGMTEASGLIAIDAVGNAGDSNDGAGSVGWALPYTEVQVRRLESDGRLGAACAPHEVGVVCVLGPHVSPGYRNPAHNAGVFDAGVLNTGDLAYLDDDSRLHIAGRSKDLIIRSGHNIDPVMIENAMALHPAVATAAAVGCPDAYAGEVPVCFVALRSGALVTNDELHEHAQAHIGERPAWPKQFFIVDAIPLTSVGKIYKPQLRCDAAARLVTGLLRSTLGLADAQVNVTDGGKRGMRVRVTLPESARTSVAAVEQALAAFLFETEVVVA